MQRFKHVLLGVLLCLGLGQVAQAQVNAVLGGTVVTSAQALRAEVLVEDGRVVAVVEPASDLAASFVTGCDEVIDATGKLVIPGGIDVHTHLDAQLAWDPMPTSSCWIPTC